MDLIKAVNSFVEKNPGAFTAIISATIASTITIVGGLLKDCLIGRKEKKEAKRKELRELYLKSFELISLSGKKPIPYSSSRSSPPNRIEEEINLEKAQAYSEAISVRYHLIAYLKLIILGYPNQKKQTQKLSEEIDTFIQRSVKLNLVLVMEELAKLMTSDTRL